MIIIKDSTKLDDVVCALVGCTKEQLQDKEFITSPLSKEWKIYEHVDFRNSIMFSTINYNQMLYHLKELNEGILFEDTKISENPEDYAHIPTIMELKQYLTDTLFNT